MAISHYGLQGAFSPDRSQASPAGGIESDQDDEEDTGVKALVADPDEYLLDLLAYALRRDGFNVLTATDGNEVLANWDDWCPDIALLEADLPGVDGFELCRRFRDLDQVPLVMITSRVEEADVVRALDAGADDCVTKPISTKLLIGRMHAILRRYRHAHQDQPSLEVRIGGLTLDTESHQVAAPEKSSRRVQLTAREFRILHLLATNEGQVIPYSRIWERACGYCDQGGSYLLKTHISTIRKKLELLASGPGAIEAVAGLGYRLVAESLVARSA
jgi:two-component system, OmpR family, response regulator RegX3